MVLCTQCSLPVLGSSSFRRWAGWTAQDTGKELGIHFYLHIPAFVSRVGTERVIFRVNIKTLKSFLSLYL